MMNKYFLIALISCFTYLAAKAQAISDNEKLCSTAKLWGFLKYYHPQVAKGRFDWDQQLLDLLAKVDEQHNADDLAGLYNAWVASLGTVVPCKSCDNNITDHFTANLDLSWIHNNQLFNPELRPTYR